jgi:hypothetical protein
MVCSREENENQENGCQILLRTEKKSQTSVVTIIIREDIPSGVKMKV